MAGVDAQGGGSRGGDSGWGLRPKQILNSRLPWQRPSRASPGDGAWAGRAALPSPHPAGCCGMLFGRHGNGDLSLSAGAWPHLGSAHGTGAGVRAGGVPPSPPLGPSRAPPRPRPLEPRPASPTLSADP